MVEKLIQISEREEEAIASLAENLGLSEAEVVHRALAEFLERQRSHQFVSQSNSAKALEGVIARAKGLAEQGCHLPEGYRFNRAEIYEERERGLT